MDKIKYVCIALLSFLLIACKEDYSDGKPTINIKVLPHTSAVKIGKTRQFTATITSAKNTSVTWLVEEEGGGTINSSGVYTAPETLGTYHIRATSVAYPEKSDRVAVTVVPLEFANVRVLHVSPDAPKVDVWFDETLISEEVDFENSTGYQPLIEGIHSVVLEGIVPGSDSITVDEEELDFAPNIHYDLITVGNLADTETIVIEDTGSLSDPNKVRIRFAHMAPAAAEVKVYLTELDADPASATPIGTLEFKESLGAIEVASGSYRIRATLMDDTLIYESHEVAFSVGSNLLIGITESTGIGDAPVSVAILNTFAVFVERDIASGAALRFVNAAADEAAIDITALDTDTPIVTDFTFLEQTNYLDIPADIHFFNLTAAGTVDPVLGGLYMPLSRGSAGTSVVLSNMWSLSLGDDIRPITTAAKVRVAHGSSLVEEIDIYVVPTGNGISGVVPQRENITLMWNTGYFYVAAGDYDLVVTPAESISELVRVPFTVANGDIFTHVLRDGAGLTTPLEIITLDDVIP